MVVLNKRSFILPRVEKEKFIRLLRLGLEYNRESYTYAINNYDRIMMIWSLWDYSAYLAIPANSAAVFSIYFWAFKPSSLPAFLANFSASLPRNTVRSLVS